MKKTCRDCGKIFETEDEYDNTCQKCEDENMDSLYPNEDWRKTLDE